MRYMPRIRLVRQRALRWLLLTASLAIFAHAHAESVYKCIDDQDRFAFQATPCALTSTQAIVAIEPAPARSAAPDYGIRERTQDSALRAPKQAAPARRASSSASQPLSYECRMADGGLFFRHASCPKSVPSSNGAQSGKRRGKTSNGGIRTLSVTSRPVPRAEACRQIRSAGAIGRDGHEHDEEVSTYDKNLGRDPCRWY